MRLHHFLFLTVPAALSFHACAAILTEQDFFGELPVVLTVSKMAQPLRDSPSSVTVIDQGMIRASGFHDIPDLLRLVPGFSVGYTRDNTYAVGYHGFADAFSRRFQVLVDGRSIYSPHFGTVEWSALPLAMEDIERIEVVRGPDAAVYGANAFFAIINIVSKAPSVTQGRMLQLLAGEQNMAGAVFRYGGKKDDLQYRLTLSSQHRDRFETGYYDPVEAEFDNLYERTYTRTLNGRLDYQLSNSDEISAQIGLTTGTWNAGRESDPIEDRSLHPFGGFAQIRFNRVNSADEEWTVQFSHSYSEEGKERFVLPAPLPAGDVVGDTDIRQWRTQLDFSSTRRLDSSKRLVWGGELRHEAVQSVGSYSSGSTLDGVKSSLFGHVEWRPHETLLVQGGTQIGHHYFSGLEFSPRLALSYQFNPRHTLRLAASRATRAPTFFEQKGNFAYYNSSGILLDQITTPSLGLDAEINQSVEIGYLGLWPEWGTQFDIRLYRDHVTNYIGDQRLIMPDGLAGNNKVFQYVNGGTLDVTGADVQAVWKPSRKFSLHLTQSFARIEAGNNIVDDDLPKSAPDWTTSLLANWRITPAWQLSGMVYRTDRMMWLSDGDITKAYTRMDFRLARQIKSESFEGEVALGVQNAGDDYPEFRRQNVFSSRAYATLKMNW